MNLEWQTTQKNNKPISTIPRKKKLRCGVVVQYPVNCEALPGPALSNRSLWQRRAKLASLQALWPWRSDFNLNGYTSVPHK